MTIPPAPLPRVLVVDDETAAVEGIELILESSGIEPVETETDSRNVMSLLKQNKYVTCLLDLSMPYLSGKELLAQIHRTYPTLPVIVVTGHNDVETAIDCMKAGAFDYLVKPVQEARLTSAVKRAIDFFELKTEYTAFKKRVLSNAIDNPDAFEPIITNNARMHAAFQYLETIAPTSRPVLITGETGVGKELFAEAIHRLSQRKGKYLAVNVAGLEDNVFSDTLFGHQKGAFTGADKHRFGLVESADKGTLFLDEIGDLEQTSQVKLLRLLQENEFYPLGADAAKLSETRIIVATNCDLMALQQENKFRQDLYFRLQTHHVHIPPLRQRPDDIPLLLDYFLQKAATTLDKPKPTPPKELPILLASYHFPGNVRELESMVFDAVSNHKSKILSMRVFKRHMEKNSSLESPFRSQIETRHDSKPVSPFSFLETLPTLAEVQTLLIKEAVARASGNQTVAAQMLGITRSGLSKAIKRKKL